MATVTKPIALDESINTTENPSRNIADVLAEELKGIADNILPPNASQIAYDNTGSGLTATNVQDAIDEVISSQADVIADTLADLTENKTATVTDGVADFETIDGSLVKSLVVEIEPLQSGTGTPSPSNIRPITGWTQEDVLVAGKNWADIIQGGCATNGTITVDSTRLCNSDYIPVKAGQTFTVSLTNLTQKTKQGYFRLFATKGTTNIRYSDSWTNLPFSVTVQEGEYFLQLVFRNSDNSDITPSDANIQLELGSTATAFEPYKGKTYKTPFNQTVYGGTLDVLTGELTIDRVIATVNDFTSAEGTGAGGLKYRNFEPSNYINTPDSMMCNVLPYIEGNSAWSGTTPCYTSNSTRLRVYYENGTWSNYSDIEIVYPLATPTTISLTPQTVKSLVGENHISASTGDVTECKYSMLINGDDLAMLLS